MKEKICAAAEGAGCPMEAGMPQCGGCGHGHEHGAQGAGFPVRIAVSAGLVLVGMLLERFGGLAAPAAATLCAAALLSGYPVFWGGLKSLVRLRFNEEVLMSVAVVAAACTGEFFEAALVTVLFGLGNYIEGRAEGKSMRDIERLAEIRPDTAHRLSEGGAETVPAEQVSVGDRIEIYPHERVPLDGVIESGVSALDSSALTGESAPVPAEAGVEVLSGMMNGSGTLTVRVVNCFGESAASRILDMVREAAGRKGRAEKLITRFSEIYTPVVIVLAVLLMAVPPLAGLGAFSDWFHRALVFLVASCPCALVISVPLGFFAGNGALAKRGLLVKGGKYIEALAGARAVLFDKTGTLTSGELSVVRIKACGAYSREEVLSLAARAEARSTHPAARAILAAAGGGEAPAAQSEEIGGFGVRAEVDGHTVLCGQRRLMERYGVAAGPGGAVFVAVDGSLAGEILLADTPRPDAAQCVARLRALGVDRVAMLTGDNPHTAAAVAKACGVEEYYAELLPEHKVALAERLRAESGTLLFLGDGINDAPALAVADCGIAMGFGTDAAAEAADAVLASDSLCRIPEAIRIARRAMRVVRFNIWFALAVKLIVLVLAGFGAAPMWAAVFADVGVTVLTVLNAARILRPRPRD